MLAIEFEGGSGERVESKISSSDSSSDSEVDVTAISTPTKKRVRGGMKFGNLSGISGLKANHDLSSDGESSEDPNSEFKKPRISGEDGSEINDDRSGLVTDEESGESLGSEVEHVELPLEDPGPTGDGAEFPAEGTQ